MPLGQPHIWHLHGHGTLAANMVALYKMPFGATLIQVDATATTAAVGTVIIGTIADDNGYLTAFTFGASGAWTTATRGEFTGALMTDTAECPHFAKDDVIQITVAHNSMINPDLYLTFLED